MKAGIITFHNVINYGAALQALALQETLQKKGADVQIINYTPEDVFDMYKPFSAKRFRRACKNSWKLALKDVASNVKNYRVLKKKRTAFANFGKKYFHYSGEACKEPEMLKDKLPDYDVCFTGSDQVWNPNLTKGFDPAYFLDFGKDSMVRASYAASIGKDGFPEEEQKEIAGYLQNMDMISVREKTAANALSPLTDKPVEVALDPTLLLSKKDWEELLSVNKGKGGYILAYALHFSAQLNAFAEKLSKENNLPVIHFSRKKLFSGGEERRPCADPREFVELFANADFVVTNSFHGTAFSVNFSKNFVTFIGGHRSSRITDLLGTLGIPERAVSRYSEELLNLGDIDYASVQEKLAAERSRSLEYIKTVLERAEVK